MDKWTHIHTIKMEARHRTNKLDKFKNSIFSFTFNKRMHYNR